MVHVVTLWMLIVSIFFNRATAQDCRVVGCPAGSCCSKWGFCGNSELHCADAVTVPTTLSTISTTTGVSRNICNPPCAPGHCCSKWGFCGDSSLHCENGYAQNNETTNAVCRPPCASGSCCSKWGFCGNSPLHCLTEQNNQTHAVNCQPPCRSGSCCSRWGFCGDSPLHCSSGGTVAPTNATVSTPAPDIRCPPPCPSGMCCSKWGFCGSTAEHCAGQTTPATQNETSLTRARFDCIFDQIDPALRDKRWQGLQDALKMVPFKLTSQNELMIFLAHVSHETDGLKTLEEYCGQSGGCADDYNDSWCSPTQAEPGKQYYGRGWFQLSWPCNYNAAGNALGVDLLKNPEQVAESETLAAATALWFWNANNMGAPARDGNFAATTQIINKIECGPTPQQGNRIKRYQKVRQCFGLPEETNNLQC